jgi:hypothetical protein
MAKIINEIPDELKDEETTEVELTSEDKQDYEAAAESKKEEAKKETKPKQDELDFDLEIEDDTRPEDRGREPLPDTIKKELEEDTLEDYSERVKNRMAQLKKVWHDERRAKEAAAREREEAVKYAQSIIEENRRLKSTLSTGEQDYLKTLKEKYEVDLAVAKRDYKDAYDSGDSEKVVEAQTRMAEAQYKLQAALNQKPQYFVDDRALQYTQNERQLSQQINKPVNIPKPDNKALEWQDKNTWFGKDPEMTSLALGLHEKLVQSGISPTSDEYYRRIDSTMQKRFPEYFGETDSLEDKPAQRKPSTVVAPATRSTAPKKVRLTRTQLALAKKFKLTPEQYARELLKTENANG